MRQAADGTDEVFKLLLERQLRLLGLCPERTVLKSIDAGTGAHLYEEEPEVAPEHRFILPQTAFYSMAWISFSRAFYRKNLSVINDLFALELTLDDVEKAEHILYDGPTRLGRYTLLIEQPFRRPDVPKKDQANLN